MEWRGKELEGDGIGRWIRMLVVDCVPRVGGEAMAEVGWESGWSSKWGEEGFLKGSSRSFISFISCILLEGFKEVFRDLD